MATSIIHSDPEILSGVPVFRGTRVPIQILFDFLIGNETIDDFLDSYPHISRDMVNAILAEVSEKFSMDNYEPQKPIFDENFA